MTGLIAALDRRLRAPAPPTRLAALRVLVGGYALGWLLLRLPHLLDVARAAGSRFDPVGPLAWMDRPAPTGTAVAVLLATIGAGVGFTAGWRWRLSGPAFAVGFLAVTTYRSSWGQIFHTENLLVLHLGVLAAAPSADAWSLDSRRRRGQTTAESDGPEELHAVRYGWPAQLMVVIVVVAYLVAGWAKLRASGFGWASGDALRNLVAHDALRKEVVGGSASPIARFALRQGWIFAPMAVLSLAAELLAPVALLGGRIRVAWVAVAWLFHLGVLAVMGIMFPYQVFGVAFAAFVTVESLSGRTRANLSRWTARRTS